MTAIAAIVAEPTTNNWSVVTRLPGIRFLATAVATPRPANSIN